MSSPNASSGWHADVSEFDDSKPEVLVSASANGDVLTLILDLAGQEEALGRGEFKADVDIVQMVNGQPDSTGVPSLFPVKSPNCRWDMPVSTTDNAGPKRPAQQWPSESIAPPNTSSPPSILPPGPPPNSTPPIPVSGVDRQGFLEYPAARCESADSAAMDLRTNQSLVVVCRNSRESLYYKGMRLSDFAAIRLDNVTSEPDRYTATNPADGTRYEFTLRGLVIVVGGQVAASENAIESAFL